MDGLARPFNLYFKLGGGVTCVKGKPLAAADAVFSVQTVANPVATYGYAFTSIKSIRLKEAGSQ